MEAEMVEVVKAKEESWLENKIEKNIGKIEILQEKILTDSERDDPYISKDKKK